MASGDEIRIDEEARSIIRALETHDPKSPGPSDIRQVTGPANTSGSERYRDSMRARGEGSRKWFETYLQIIRRDCAIGVKALDDFSQQDAEIMALLKKYDEEVESSAIQGATGRTSLPGATSATPRGTESSPSSANTTFAGSESIARD